MALPHHQQALGKWIFRYRGLTAAEVADKIGIKYSRLSNIIKGHTYPTPEEIDALEALIGMPAEVLFDPEMLAYRESWPPPRGAALWHAEIERLRAEIEGGE